MDFEEEETHKTWDREKDVELDYVVPIIDQFLHQLDAAVSAVGETMSTGVVWYPTALNIVQGESWFVTLSGTGTTGAGGTNTDFTLEPGTYELTGNMPFMSAASIYGFCAFYDVTNSKVQGVTRSNILSDWSGAYDGSTGIVETVVTIGTATKYRFQGAIQSAPGLARMGATSDISLDRKPVLSQVKIRKLK